MISNDLKNLLTGLDLIDNQAVFFSNKEDGSSFSFLSNETEKKLNIIQPTAYYIFNDQPYILFFDLTLEQTNIREKEIHKQVWSFDQSPLIFIVKVGDVILYNAFEYDKKQQKLKQIHLKRGEDRNEIFSFWNLQSGNTWSWLQANHYQNKVHRKRVNQKLFENIQLVRENLTSSKNKQSLNEDDANILILRLIFIRYLIDRNVNLNPEFISGGNITDRRKSFSYLIEDPIRLNIFFENLNNKFNGVLFKDIKVPLSHIQARSLSLVFNGEKPEIGTLFHGTELYFEIFDFSIIPVEVISGIYESLIDKETRLLHSAVYTPSFLVEYILSNTIDPFLNERTNIAKTECRVFDPSVGSGIFLVQAFRRMVDKEILILKDQKISKTRLREIAQNNLFGVDLNEQALKVTCFSIYIAILDYQDPKTILDNFHFPELLNENLFQANYFDTQHIFNEAIRSKKIDFILGNPPWKSNKDNSHTKWLKDNNKIVGRYEIAQSFLLRSKEFMLFETVSALIVTSTIFYNVSETAKKFKRDFLTQFCLDSFFDLSPVRRFIFEEKNNPCSIVFYRISDGSHLTNIVKHLSLKSNTFLKYYKTLVIEKFDQKTIQQQHFIENDWMFKVALYGNTLDFLLLKKLERQQHSIINLINNTTLFKGAGIKRGKDATYFPELENLPLIDNNEVTPFYSKINSSKVLSKEDTYLARGRRIEIFKGSKILFKEQNHDESDPIISYVEKTSVFRNGVSSIATESDVTTLKTIYGLVVSNLYTYFLFIKSCSWGVSTRPQTRLDDEYLSFPYKQPKENIQIELIQLVDKFLKSYQKYYKKFSLGNPNIDDSTLVKINTIVEQIYDIKGYELDLIDYVLEISRYQFQESKQMKIIRKIHDDRVVLTKYAEIFLQEFNNIYQGEYMHVTVYPINHFIAMNFTFSEVSTSEKVTFKTNSNSLTQKQIFSFISSSISVSKITKDLYIQKDIKGFEENSFYIIKPNEYKCWHRAMAWYDVSEVKEAIQSAEIERLTVTLDNVS